MFKTEMINPAGSWSLHCACVIFSWKLLLTMTTHSWLTFSWLVSKLMVGLLAVAMCALQTCCVNYRTINQGRVVSEECFETYVHLRALSASVRV